MSRPLISIITCTKNSEKYLKKCLRSVEVQTYKNIEHILVDGLSTDNTLKILNDYIHSNKKRRIKLVQSEPKGIANAMNIGYKNSTGEVIHFLHSDDYYYSKSTLKRVVEYFDQNPGKNWLVGNSVVSYMGRVFSLPVTILMKGHLEQLICTYNIISHENTFVKREIFEKYGLFDETLKVNMDFDYWLRIIKDKDNQPIVIDDNFTVFIVHKGSTSSNPRNWPNAIKEYYNVLKKAKYLPFVGNYENSYLYKHIKELIDRTSL